MKVALTGAFSYSGKYMARELLEQGHEVITLTGTPDKPDPFDGKIAAYPFSFDDPTRLEDTLKGVDTLINTYWVRFDHGEATYLRAVSNTRTMFRAAKHAGVKKVVHISITNPDPQSNLPYFWGKAILEEDLISSGMRYAILRPTVIFGKEDILINNIAWFLRRFPFFPIPGDGEYRLQPIYVGDLAKLAAASAMSDENSIVDAIGPETFTFRSLLEMLREQLNLKTLLLPSPPRLALSLSRFVGNFVGDHILTDEELIGLMDDLLYVTSLPAGQTRLTDWVAKHADTLGKHYAHEIRRHYNSSPVLPCKL